MLKRFILIGFILISVITGYAQDIDNTKPMYGNIEKTGKYKDADNEFVSAVLKQFGSKDSACKIYVNYAWRHLFNNDKLSSIKRFNQAWMLNPKNCDVYYGFYAYEMLENNQSEAEKYFEIGQGFDKNNKNGLKTIDLLTTLYAQRNQNMKVYELCFKMIKLDSTFFEPYRTLGYYYSLDNDSVNTLRYYNLAISKNPYDTLTIINRGCYYQSLKQYDKSLKDFEKVIEMNKNCLQGYSNRGLLHFVRENYDLAILDFEFLLKKVPDNEKGYYFRMIGLSKIKLNEKEDGCKCLKTAKKYGDNLLGNDSLKQLIKENCK